MDSLEGIRKHDVRISRKKIDAAGQRMKAANVCFDMLKQNDTACAVSFCLLQEIQVLAAFS